MRNSNKEGLQHLLHTPASPMTKSGLEAFREMKKSSGMTTPDILRYIGKKAKMPSQVHQDKSQQEKRMDILQN